MLNFGLAKEQYAAQHPEKADRAKFLIVGDDVAVSKSQGKIVGRRCVDPAHSSLCANELSDLLDIMTSYAEVSPVRFSCTRSQALWPRGEVALTRSTTSLSGSPRMWER